MSNYKQRNSKSWMDAFKVYFDIRAVIMLFLGFAAGIPILLIFSSLSLWLREAGVDKSTVTMFSWAALGYSFKFIWAPLVDALPVPILTKNLGRRRSWMLLAQLGVIAGILAMGSINPIDQSMLVYMALGAVLLGFSSATQDIVIDAYRIELAPPSMQSILSAVYIAGYRIGMVVAGAGALYLADFFGSTKEVYNYEAWRNTYYIMASIMGIAIATTLAIKEPGHKLDKDSNSTVVKSVDKQSMPSDYLRLVLVFLFSIVAFIFSYVKLSNILPEVEDVLLKFLVASIHMMGSLIISFITGFVLTSMGLVKKEIAMKTWVEPVVDFFKRYGKKALLLLMLIGLYRISDIIAGVISNVFYQDMNFTKTDIANAVKVVGVLMSIFGGFLGGFLSQKMRIMHAMMIGAILASITNLLFILLASHPGDAVFLYLAVILDNLAAGLASAVFVAFLSALTSIRFTAVQYAIFSSLMTLIPKVLGGYSGSIIESTSYEFFFGFTFAIGIPILFLIWAVDKYIDIGEPKIGDK